MSSSYKPQPQPPSNNNNMRPVYSSMMTSPVDASTGTGSNDVHKRKRGRPRKYPADASVSSVSRPAAVMLPPAGAQRVDGGGNGDGYLSPAARVAALLSNSSGKKRGRPPGALNKQQHPQQQQQPAVAVSGSPGVGFMPHILNVKAGEDVLAKLMWFSQNSTRALCIMSANGAVSNVTLRQQATSGGTVTYEGRFEILSLAGSFMVSEVDGQRSRTGGLSVALSGPDGRVLGGNVAGLLIAASPVQVIVGSFVPASQKQTRTVGNHEPEVVNAPASESSGGGLGSPLAHSNNSNPQAMANMPWR